MQNETERRLAQVEQQLQQNRRINRLLFASILLLAFMGFRQNDILGHITVKSLTVVNDSGKVMARLNINPNGSQLQLFDSAGILQSESGASKFGGYLSLYNKKNQHTVWLTQMRDGGGYAGIKNTAGKEVAALGVNNDKSGYVTISNAEGKQCVAIASDNGSGIMRWYNRMNNTTVQISGADNSFSGGIRINNRFGGQRLYLGVNNNDIGAGWFLNNNGKVTHNINASGIFIKNSNEQDRIWLSVANNDGGFLNLYNRYNQRNIFLGARDGIGAEGILFTSDGFRDTGVFPK